MLEREGLAMLLLHPAAPLWVLGSSHPAGPMSRRLLSPWGSGAPRGPWQSKIWFSQGCSAGTPRWDRVPLLRHGAGMSLLSPPGAVTVPVPRARHGHHHDGASETNAVLATKPCLKELPRLLR